jgi:hypothetical protein
MLGLAACGDSGAPAGPTAVVGEAATAVLEAPTGEPTEAASDGWKTFTSEADGFAVDMPGEPQASNQSTESSLGEITFYFFQLAAGDAQYVASYNDYPVASESLDAEQLLNDAIEGAAQGSEVDNLRMVEVQGNPGIEGEINALGVTHVWYRAILVANRMYQLIVTAPEASKEEFDAGAWRFIDSFKLLGQ